MQFARRLARRGHHVTLVTANPERSLRPRLEWIDGVRVIIMPGVLSWRMRRGALEPLDVLGRIIHALKEPYDLVHCDGHRPASSFQAITADVARGTPWISEWVDLFGGEGVAGNRRGLARYIAIVLETWWEERVRLLADGVIAISQGLFQRALDIGISPQRLVYIPGGADVEHIQLRTVKEARQALGLDPNARIVGLIGYELADREDAALVLEACARLRTCFPSLRLLVTGKDPLDEKLITSLKLESILIRPGWVSTEEYPLWLSAVNVFALPFRNTVRNVCKWPMKVGDFLAAGRPIVTNPTGDMATLFKEHMIGLLVDETPEEFAHGLAMFLDNPALADRVGCEARRVAQGPLSWDALTDKLEDVYFALVGSGRWST